MKIIQCEQLSPEWWAARNGVPTASEFGRILTPKTLKPSAGAQDYAIELIADLLSPSPLTERYQSPAMANGTLTEPEARRWYEMDSGYDVEQVGFITTNDGRFGCSPDGMIAPNGGLELKCPAPKTHLRYLLAGEVPADYLAQVHGALIVTGRAWWDFVSYAPGLPPLVVRTECNAYTLALKAALETFWEQYTELLARVKALQEVPV